MRRLFLSSAVTVTLTGPPAWSKTEWKINSELFNDASIILFSSIEKLYSKASKSISPKTFDISIKNSPKSSLRLKSGKGFSTIGGSLTGKTVIIN